MIRRTLLAKASLFGASVLLHGIAGMGNALAAETNRKPARPASRYLPIPDGYVRTGQMEQVPPAVLYGVALQESARMFGQYALPYPWTLNVAGEPRRFRTHAEAVNGLRESVRRGRGIFDAIGCAGCHVPSFITGDAPGFPEISRQSIHPYTDLLLHDMGPDLADGRSDGEATGREWRTPPLWGIGLVGSVNGHTRLLHDGRARGIDEAILWHGGEAERSRGIFLRLSSDDRNALLAFLRSL